MSDYYDRNAHVYFSATVGLDMEELYRPFLALLPPGAAILDAGCGSGRDAKRFIERGYRVTAFDASPELAARAALHTGLDVRVLRFQQLDYRAEFDGVWACASLVHVPSAELAGVLERLRRALKPGGIAYVSFKYGNFEGEKDGRYFTHFTPESFNDWLFDCAGWELTKAWVTQDVRAQHASEKWLNVLLTGDGRP